MLEQRHMTGLVRTVLLAGAGLLGGCALGPSELAIILAIVVLLFGASRLPQLGRALGEMLRDFRKATSSDDRPPDQIAGPKGHLDPPRDDERDDRADRRDER